MRILDIQPPPERGAWTNVLAVFDVELSEGVRMYGLKLIENGNRRLTYAPSANGGRRTATFSPAVADQITAAAFSEYERHVTANGHTPARTI